MGTKYNEKQLEIIEKLVAKGNVKCATCARFKSFNDPCVVNHMTNNAENWPDYRLENNDSCTFYETIPNDEQITLEDYLNSGLEQIKQVQKELDEMDSNINNGYELDDSSNGGYEPISREEYEDFVKRFNENTLSYYLEIEYGENEEVDKHLLKLKYTSSKTKQLYTAEANFYPFITIDNLMNIINECKYKISKYENDDLERIAQSRVYNPERIEQNEIVKQNHDKLYNESDNNLVYTEKVEQMCNDEKKEAYNELKKQYNVSKPKQDSKFTDKDVNILSNIQNCVQELLKKSGNTQNTAQEQMLEGETKIGWFEQVTSWKRVVNAARRTIGKNKLEKDPSDSWKAKILLAEHSPIRLLEFDFGWEAIRQWVTVHLVRHHIGVEKFVHSQRGDRRELPCDRDHIYQGAKNDMDMTVNAQALMNMSRKRCCNCASLETRQAWKLVLDEVKKDNPVLYSKCVPECVYRGFCPEWMSKCKYCYSDAYWKQLAEYRNTIYGKDIKYKYIHEAGLIISNTGKIYYDLFNTNKDIVANNDGCIEPDFNNAKEIIPEKDPKTGKIFVINLEGIMYEVSSLVYNSFVGSLSNIIPMNLVSSLIIKHRDGNIWNNVYTNLYEIGNAGFITTK